MGRAAVLSALALALALAGGLAVPARAAPSRSVLLVLDSSKSMNEPAGGGVTRLEAAKSAAKELLAAVPADAAVGLRVYGAKVAEASRAAGCRDSELVLPVAKADRTAIASAVDALEGKGRTPIGRSLLAAPGDLPPGGRRTLILVSDGGDNCAPPDPCKAAAQVSRQGVDMTIQVVGLQVSGRVRDQLRCIADAGGGAYADAQDPAALRAQLAAALARAFRPYEPSGRPIAGGPGAGDAVATAPGRYLDDLGKGRARWYAVRVAKGQRLFAAATIVAPPPPATEVSSVVRVELVAPGGKSLHSRASLYRTTGGRAPVGTFAASMPDPAAADGVYLFGVTVEEAASGLDSPLPMEVTFGVGGAPGSAVAAVSEAPARRGTGTQADSDLPELAGIGAAGLVLGGLGGLIAAGRRRP